MGGFKKEMPWRGPGIAGCHHDAPPCGMAAVWLKLPKEVATRYICAPWCARDRAPTTYTPVTRGNFRMSLGQNGQCGGRGKHQWGKRWARGPCPKVTHVHRGPRNTKLIHRHKEPSGGPGLSRNNGLLVTTLGRGHVRPQQLGQGSRVMRVCPRAGRTYRVHVQNGPILRGSEQLLVPLLVRTIGAPQSVRLTFGWSCLCVMLVTSYAKGASAVRDELASSHSTMAVVQLSSLT